MPEGDTIYKIGAVLRQGLVDAPIEQIWLPHVSAVSKSWKGLSMTAVEVLGKHTIFHLPPYGIRVHLGMHGSWHRRSLAEATKARRGQISICAGGFRFDCYQPKEVEVKPLDQIRHQLSRLGPDLLASEPSWAELPQRASRYWRPEQPVCEVLVDQRVAAGLGNVYKSELCFLGPLKDPNSAFEPAEGYHPLSPWSQCDLVGLFQRGRLLLQANLGGWPRTTTYDRRRGPQHPQTRPALWVYQRHHSPCLVCQGPIATGHLVSGAQDRTTQWCPHCQSAAPLEAPAKL